MIANIFFASDTSREYIVCLPSLNKVVVTTVKYPDDNVAMSLF